MMQSSWPVVMCRPTQSSNLSCKKLNVLLGKSSPSPVAELFLLVQANKFLNKQRNHNLLLVFTVTLYRALVAHTQSHGVVPNISTVLRLQAVLGKCRYIYSRAVVLTCN